MTKLDFEKNRLRLKEKTRGDIVNPRIDNELDFVGKNDVPITGSSQQLKIYQSFQKKVRLVYLPSFQKLTLEEQLEILNFIRRWHFDLELDGYLLSPTYRQAERIIEENQINLLKFDQKRMNDLEDLADQFLINQSRKDLKKLIRRIDHSLITESKLSSAYLQSKIYPIIRQILSY
jgi:hypothetical protein